MSNPIQTKKKLLRVKFKRLRGNIDPETRRQASLAICRHIESWTIFQDANVVLTYMAMQSEVDLSPLLKSHLDKRWGIPRVRIGGKMQFHRYDPQKLVRHSFGMLEPDSSCPVIPTEEIQLVLVPGLAFDWEGWRLGYGSGFYDRFLSKAGGDFAGITFQALLASHIPHSNHDIPMPFLITETGVKTLPETLS